MNEALPQGWKLHGVSQGPALDPWLWLGDQKPHNSGCCKSESEKIIDLSLFSGSGRFWTRRRRLVDDHVHQTLWFLDGNWIPRYYTFFCNFLKNVFGEMNLSKCICPNIFVQMYFSKCICKMYLSKCIFFVSLHLSDQMSQRSEVSRIAL